jgi:type IV pilus assembly protein PilY1
MSWTIPFCGRIKLPDKDVTRFYTGAPPATPQPFSSGIVSVPEFDRTLGGLITDEPTSDSFYSPHKRHLAFIACKFQYFEQDLHPNPSDPIIAGDDSATMKLLRQPHMLAIDIETGENLFKYVWPWVYSDLTLSEFPKNIRGEFRVPCSFSDPSVIDVWNTEKSSIGSDGYVDHIFMGDLCGNLWGLKLLNFDEEAITSDDIGLSVEMWPTRAVRGDANTLTGYDNFPWSNYRTDTQPITHRPAISLSPKEDYPNQQLRIIFGTGKYDDTYVRPSDREDPAIMSLYNLAYPITPDVTDYDEPRSIPEFGAFNMYFKYRGISRANMFDSSQRLAAYPEENTCRWTQENTLEGDCCKRDSELNGCPDSPDWWKCVYDFTLPDKAPWGFGDPALATTVFGLPDPSLTPTGLPGERVLHRPLIANDYVYVTTYIPPTKVCEPGGRSYLYVFDYMCRPFPDDFQPPDNPAFPTYPLMVPDGEGGSVQFGAIIDLGEGLASEAVLSGEHLIIQMTDGTILNPEAIDPPKGVRIRAWREVASD